MPVSHPPPRPPGWRGLPFTPRPAVRWFTPALLARAGLRALLSAEMGAYLDKRELQATRPGDTFRHLAEQDELWLDYLADTGDGFDATTTVAWAVSQPSLAVAGVDRPLPRGQVLVLGGDQVYPYPAPGGYEDRLVGPYTAALPWTAPPHPEVYAVPGNHDWYDGLTSFLRVFADGGWLGGRRTRQRRSYFAVQLPHRWWLWGIDIHLDVYIDDPQLEYFRAVDLRPDDAVVLCTAEPSWVDAAARPAAYRNLAFVERHLVRPSGARVALTLSGDSHHYARYQGDDGTAKVTSGIGGAFLHPTHDLPRRLRLRVAATDPAPVTYELARRYPDAGVSRRLLSRALLLPWRNPSFLAVPAGLQLAVWWAAQLDRRRLGRGGLAEVVAGSSLADLAAAPLRSPSALLLLAAAVGLLVAFAEPPPGGRRATRVALGAAHAALQYAVLTAVAWVAVRTGAAVGGGAPLLVAAAAVVALGGGVAGAVTVGAYLAGANLLLGAHANEGFAALRHAGHKGFLRLHLGADGRLAVYAVGLDRPVRRWRVVPGATDPSAPWVVPDGDHPRPRLVDAFVVAGEPEARRRA